MNKVYDNVWIGNSIDARDVAELKKNHITAVLNCATDLPDRVSYPEFAVAHCGLGDGPGNPPDAYVSAVRQLSCLLQLKHQVLVHCHEGKSRSASVVIMYLDLVHGLGWDYWFDEINKVRDINPHPAHKECWSLIRYGVKV